MSEVVRVIRTRAQAGECPVWNEEEQAIYWTDVLDERIHRFYPETGMHDTFNMDVSVSGIGLRSRGGLVLATWKGFAFWDEQTTDLEIFSNPPEEQEGSRFNDAAVDRKGRFWAGAWGGMGKLDPTNKLYRLDPDGSIKTMETGIIISNGIGWSPDNETMYFTDSPRRTIYAYDFDFPSGEIDNRRIFAKLPEEEGEPDGLAVDSEGFVWSARWDGWKITRFDPEGSIEREIHLPVQRPTSCTFGGPGLDELYITTASVGLTTKELNNQPLAGDLIKLQTEFKGDIEPKYLG
jgi:sugar lactone lactonase YvrE